MSGKHAPRHSQEFRTYIKNLRNRRKLSITSLAALIGVSTSYISQIESGERYVPSPDILRRLAAALGVSYEELMLKAGYISKNTEAVIINDARLKDIFDNLSPGKKELLHVADNFSEESIFMLVDVIRGLKMDASKMSRTSNVENLRNLLQVLVEGKRN